MSLLWFGLSANTKCILPNFPQSCANLKSIDDCIWYQWVHKGIRTLKILPVCKTLYGDILHFYHSTCTQINRQIKHICFGPHSGLGSYFYTHACMLVLVFCSYSQKKKRNRRIQIERDGKRCNTITISCFSGARSHQGVRLRGVLAAGGLWQAKTHRGMKKI